MTNSPLVGVAIYMGVRGEDDYYMKTEKGYIVTWEWHDKLQQLKEDALIAANGDMEKYYESIRNICYIMGSHNMEPSSATQ